MLGQAAVDGDLALPATPVALNLAARQQGEAGWEIPQFAWDDGDALRVQGSLGFAADASLRDADVSLHSRDIAPLRPR